MAEVVGRWVVDWAVVVGPLVGGCPVVLATDVDVAPVVAGLVLDVADVGGTDTVLEPTVTDVGAPLVDVGGSPRVVDAEVLDGDLADVTRALRLVCGEAGSRSPIGARVTNVRWPMVVVVSSIRSDSDTSPSTAWTPSLPSPDQSWNAATARSRTSTIGAIRFKSSRFQHLDNRCGPSDQPVCPG